MGLNAQDRCRQLEVLKWSKDLESIPLKEGKWNKGSIIVEKP